MVFHFIITFAANNKTMLLNWYSYSITCIWKFIGRASEWIFNHIIIKLGWLPDVFYILLLAFLFVLWMVLMRKYDGQRADKGLIK